MKASRVPSTEVLFSDETRLLLYALMQQAEEGPCKIRSKWGMELEERAKYETWVNLGKMDKFEAMRLYVKLVDEEKPDWWKTIPAPGSAMMPVEKTPTSSGGQSEQATPTPRSNGHGSNGDGARAGTRVGTRSPRGPLDGSDSEAAQTELPAGLADLAPGRWARPAHAGARPLPRYQHGAVLAGERMYVVGGSYRGRFMGDTHELDLGRLTWRKLEPDAGSAGESLVPCAGHRVVSHNGEVYLVGGRFKAGEGGKYMSLLRMELGALGKSVTWVPVETTGPKPGSRRGLSATVLGDTLVVFGGEDADRRYLDDAHALDLATMTWRVIDGPRNTGTIKGAPPAPRAEHTAAAWGEDKLLVFGGTGASFKCFNSLHALDIRTGQWRELQPKGSVPSPRAGHAGTVVGGRYWCIVGGGNNQNGVPDTAVLDLELMTWAEVGKGAAVFPAPAVVGEGMSLCAVEAAGGDAVLVAFGGYNGACQQEVQAFRIPREFPNGPAPPLRKEKAGPTPVAAEATSEKNAAEEKKVDAAKEAPAAAPAAPAPSTREERDDGPGPSLDALKADNLRLRRENAQLREDARRVVQQQAALQARLEALEQQKADLEGKLQAETAKVAHINKEVDAMTRELDRVLAVEREHAALQERVRELEENRAPGRGENENEPAGDGDVSDGSPAPKRSTGWFGL